MKRVFIGAIIFMFMIGIVYAEMKSNASPVLVCVNSISPKYKQITFDYPTRDLIIYNNDAHDNVYVDVKHSNNVSDTGAGVLLTAGNSLELYDFITSGITIIYDSVFSTRGEASPISVIAVY